MIKKKIIILFIPVLFSCSTALVNKITLQNNGSAIVETTRELNNSDLERYNNTSLISNIDTNNYRVTYNISNIDSLGNYLPYLQKGFMQFNLDNNILSITDGNTEAFKIIDKSCSCCLPNSLVTYIKFNQEILEVNGERSFAYKRKNNTIAILKSKRQLRKNKGKINLIIKLKPNTVESLK